MDTERNLTSDAQLILAAGDDPDAFRCLYDRYARRLHRFSSGAAVIRTSPSI
jgi:hypothetical protein